MIAKTPKAPYYAVIFSSLMTSTIDDYGEMSDKMINLASKQKGFLGIESARSGLGITVSYWDSLEAIKNWKLDMEHTEARNKGRSKWYSQFKVRICKVEHDYGFEK